jgi:menaquinone-dependent protoporphyrinogen IX oxidase
MKGVIVYKGKYGATAQYANWLGNTLQIPVYESDDLSSIKLTGFDYVIAGTSVYIGKMLLAKWINSNGNILSHKKLFMFVVCGTPSAEVTKLNGMLEQNITPEVLKTMKVFFLRGRLIKSKLSLLDRLALYLGASLQKNKKERERMLIDYDDVRQENMNEMLNAIRTHQFVSVG